MSNAFVPISSPRYITVVGGTDFAVKSTIGDEKAWTDGGGGFSDTFLAPAYVWRAITECEFYMFLKFDSVFAPMCQCLFANIGTLVLPPAGTRRRRWQGT